MTPSYCRFAATFFTLKTVPLLNQALVDIHTKRNCLHQTKRGATCPALNPPPHLRMPFARTGLGRIHHNQNGSDWSP